MATHSQISAGATHKRTIDSVAYVSEWVIPGGCDYDLAYTVNGFFDDIEKAKAYADANEAPSKMACLIEFSKEKPLVLSQKLFNMFIENTLERLRYKLFDGFFAKEIAEQQFPISAQKWMDKKFPINRIRLMGEFQNYCDTYLILTD